MTNTPEYSSPSEDDTRWIQSRIEYGRSLGLASSKPREISEFFDSSLRAIDQGEQPPQDANDVVNVVAVLLGEYICATSAFGWAVVTDQFGTDLCLCSADTGWVLFPQSTVAKRWKERETGWYLPFLSWVEQQLAADTSQS